MDLRNWIRAYDTKVYRYKSWIAFGITALIAILGVMALSTTLGWSWPSSWRLARVTLTDEVQAMLALGTVALALAAMVQAVSAERTRYTSIWPHFSVNLVKNGKPVYAGEMVETPSSPPGLGFTMRNLGPGFSVGTRAVVHVWKVAGGSKFPGPLVSAIVERPPDSSFIAMDSHDLRPDDAAFPIDLEEALAASSAVLGNTTGAARVALQIVLQVEGSTVVSDSDSARGASGAFLVGTRDERGGSVGTWQAMTRAQLVRVLPVLPKFEPPPTWPEHTG